MHMRTDMSLSSHLDFRLEEHRGSVQGGPSAWGPSLQRAGTEMSPAVDGR